MSLGEASAKFPGQHSTQPNSGPGASDLNPAGVFPQSDPNPDPDPPKEEGNSLFHSVENPYALQEALNKIESAMDEIISLLEGEKRSTGAEGSFSAGQEGIKFFQGWKAELEKIKRGER